MKNTISMNVSAIGTDDGKSTFEVQRTWNEKGKKAIAIRKRRELKMLRQVNPYMSKYKIPREILEHVEDILDKKNLGKKGYVSIILNPIKDDEVDVLDELNLNCNEVEIPDNNFFYIVIKGKKHPMKKKKRWYSYDIILPENSGRIYVIYCMYEEHLRDIGVI